MKTQLHLIDQVDCAPPGNIVIRVLQYRPDAGGYLKIVPLQTAGVGAVKAVGYRSSGATVGLASLGFAHECHHMKISHGLTQPGWQGTAQLVVAT